MSSYHIGYDIGSSSIKVALVDADTGKCIAKASEPSEEMEIICLQEGWAEQNPNDWWNHICVATKRLISEANIKSTQITAIGIAYQMHGLVVVDEQGEALRDSIIWCDSRAVEIGNKAFNEIGEGKCMSHLLNSPGNFTASKLKWVKDNEEAIFVKVFKYMLPGDFIASKLFVSHTNRPSGESPFLFVRLISAPCSIK